MKEIEKGHGCQDVSCQHGSRWIWWIQPNGKGAWMKVVHAPNCDCEDPPDPYVEGLIRGFFFRP